MRPFALAALLLWSSACARHESLRPTTPPNDHAAWRQTLDQLAAGLFVALRDNRLDPVLVSFRDLDVFLTPAGRIRVERERAAHRATVLLAQTARAWAAPASYVGFCTQGAHAERAGGEYGLRRDAWIVDRVLVVARRGRSRTAAWVEGTFVHTDRGWRALSVTRIEPPRGHHTDLEVAPCDVEYGIR
jgi:hypothetical protein